MAVELYAWALGSNIALVSLNNIEAEVQAHSANHALWQTATNFVFSPPLNLFPNRGSTMDGRAFSQGRLKHYIEMTIPQEAYQYQLTTYLSGGTVIDVPITIYLKKKGYTSPWVRYNANLVYPENDGESGDFTYLTNGVVFVRYQLTNLVPST